MKKWLIHLNLDVNNVIVMAKVLGKASINFKGSAVKNIIESTENLVHYDFESFCYFLKIHSVHCIFILVAVIVT